jgi:predicted nucleotidyltransferase
MEIDESVQRRDAVASALLESLKTGCGGSDVALRGSLASGAADAYSDIDLTWVVPDGAFLDSVERAGQIANTAVGNLIWTRADPDLARSQRRRLLFLRFADLPLFWRVDLDIRAASIAADDRYDLDNPAARSDAWSRAASAFENAIAAVKELKRGRPDLAHGLLERGHARIESVPDARPADVAAALRLARVAAQRDPAIAPLVEQFAELAGGARGR